MREGTLLIRRLFAVCTIAVVGGCGGNDSREVFAAEANEICRRHSDQVRDLDQPQSYQQLLVYVDELAKLARQQIDELRAVEPPPDDAREFDRMVTQMERTLALYPELKEAAVTGRPTEIQRVLRNADASDARAAKFGRNLGLDECVQGSADDGATAP